MRRLKTVLAFVMAMVVIPVIPVFAEEPIDITAPEVISFEGFDNDNVDGSEGHVNAIIDLIEDGRGVSLINVRFTDKNTGKEYWISWDKEEGEPLYTGEHTMKIPTNFKIPVGEFSMTGLSLCDIDNNWNSYTYDPSDHICEITVTFSEYTDSEGAKVTGIKLLQQNNVDATATLPVEVTIETCKRTIQYIDFDFVRQKDGESYCAHADLPMDLSSGTYTLEFEFYNEWPTGTYVLTNVDATDSRGDDCERFNPMAVATKAERTIYVTKSNCVTVREPEIKGFSISNSEIVTPGVIHAELVLKEYGTVATDLSLSFMGAHKDYYLIAPLTKVATDERGNSIYKANVPIGPFTESGKLELRTVHVSSEGPKDVSTILTRENFVWQEDLTDITINSPYDITYFGALGNSGYIEKIKGMNEGETAAIDYSFRTIVPKELFQAIAGKDVTLAFLDDEIQWVFNGLDINTASCKDVNLKHKITAPTGLSEGFSCDKRIIKIEYADNGKLPGEAQMRINDEYIRALYNLPDADLNLSYLKDNGDIVLEDDDVDMAEDKYYEYEIDHNSDFALSKGRATLGKTIVSDVSNGFRSIKITWKKTGGSGCYIYRSTTKNGKYTKIATVKGKTSFIDKKIKKGKAYYYKVKPFAKAKALNKTAKISTAHKAFARLKRPAPYNLVSSMKPSYVNLDWDPVPEAYKYAIYRSKSRNSGYKKIATVKGNGYLDVYVTHGTNYYYKVRAIHRKSKYNSDFSNPIESCSESYYRYTNYAAANLSIDGSTANVWVTLSGNTTKIEGVAYLQKYEKGKWSNIKSWTKKVDGKVLTISKTKKVSKGKYRVKGVIKAYNGTKNETVTVFSRPVKK